MTKMAYLSILSVMLMLFTVGCNNEIDDDNKVAYISINPDSKYEETFTELGLGNLFDFNLKLPRADQTWISIWVEGYRDGKVMEASPLIQLSYGLSPEQVVEGPMGFGIINPNGKDPQVFLYSKGTRTGPKPIGEKLFIESGISGWDYGIGNETVGLESGEEMVLAVYRQNEGSMRAAYDYQDVDSINEMINEDITVLLIKIKVEDRDQ
ncbi:hypothetical protein Amet_1809 [Alkaliphilus metalliredigens QYMF]|uniref:Lipoprotein n=1 Tax=Alkaliphilus metalliredigens (strain QYMF) TaxID=293826 RepID=A6TP61_ALKMQ|nr:hypothetical protein [Alkaliphilus metalliredigens]ABR47979.1 hypothetical protein Amet_1809 [Alkaliphilus metalliredigens QYMF]